MRNQLSTRTDSIMRAVCAQAARVENINQVLSIGLLYASSMFAFLASYYAIISWATIAVRALSGALVFILIPGTLVSGLVLPERLKNISTATILGIALSLVGIQISFMLSFLLVLHIPLATLLSITTSFIVLICLAYLNMSGARIGLKVSLDMGEGISVQKFVIIGAVIRLALLFLAQGSIAPDASLYADYARGIMDGQFASSVLNDYAVFDLWNETQYVAHQGFVYVFALSWLLVPPGTSGPTIILPIIGLLLIQPAYSFAERYFDRNSAKLVGVILCIHPLFTYHSSVAYGPEITSLTLMMFGMYIFLSNNEKRFSVYLIAGALIGLVDVIWYANFYILCISFPAILFMLKRDHREAEVLFGAMMLLVLIARVFFSNIILFSICWIAIFGLLAIAGGIKPELEAQKLAPFFVGIVLVISFWRWPFLLATSSSRTVGSIPETSSLVSVILAPMDTIVLGRFLFFTFFHLTPVLLIVVILALLRGKYKSNSRAFAIGGLLCALGTLKVFGHFTKDTLLPIYLYSDSRYFLFITLVLTISSAAFFTKYNPLQQEDTKPNHRKSAPSFKMNRQTLVVGLILLGFLPSYLIIPSGLALVHIEERYGWMGLPEAVNQIEDQNVIFLADRAREFSWFTGRRSAVLQLSSVYLSYTNASQELFSLAVNFSANHLIVDDYTVAHWGTLDFLLLEPISLGTSVMLGNLEIVEFYESSNIFTAPALTLIAQTESNEAGTYCRVFSFDTASFIEFQNVSMLDIGWSASNFGSITNVSGEVRLAIGNDQNSTNTWRPEGFDFNLMVNSGFLLLNLEEVSATVARIEVWDENGIILRHAEDLGNGLYYCPLGEVTIGDIRIVIEGSSGESIIVRSISVWQVENP